MAVNSLTSGTEFEEIFKVQWNLVNPTTNGTPKSGRINGVVVLKGFLNKMTDRTLVWTKENGRINEVVALSRWS